MIIGFTGTRNGMTDSQKKSFDRLAFWPPEKLRAIHGGCVGADADFHVIMREIGVPIEVYPGYSAKNPSDLQYRAEFEGAEVVHEPMTHFARNRAIVDRCDLLIACPATSHETGGGTWYTINYARKSGKNTDVINPDGTFA